MIWRKIANRAGEDWSVLDMLMAIKTVRVSARESQLPSLEAQRKKKSFVFLKKLH